ncbi:MAG: hypothetical protein ACYTHK_00070 [Planctomycetota bacterium]|jgi:hypothetical protein
MAEQPQQQEQMQPTVWRRRIFAIVLFLVVAAVIGRVMLKDEQPTGSEGGGMRTGLVAGGEVEKEETLGDKLNKLLPYITEAGIALMLGMIAGIGTRMAIKTIVVVVILGAVGIQFAIFKGWLNPEDMGFVQHLKDYVFHVPEDKEGVDVALDKAPSLGAGLLGFLMGLKKG